MGYRHYVGYIPKKDLPEIMKEVDRLKNLIGTPKEKYPDETYSQYEITSYLQDKATTVLELGKLYYKNTEPIYQALYKNKGEDYSNDDTEFFFVNDNKFLMNISYAQMEIWSEIMKKWEPIIAKILNEEKLTMDENCELLEIKELFNREHDHYDHAVNWWKKTDFGGKDFKPYFDWQFNYAAVETFAIHKNFDYENNVLCVFAY